MKRILLTLIVSTSLVAENLYVRPGGGSYGSENGSDWNNAFDGFGDVVWGSGAGALGAGDTLWVAGGTYGGFIIGASGTSSARLNIKRARSTDTECTTAAGWSAGFDSQVVIYHGGIDWYEASDGDYVTIDGRILSGIKITQLGLSGGNGITIDEQADYVELKYIECEGPGRDKVLTSDSRGIDVTPITKGMANGLLVSHCIIHDHESSVYNYYSRNSTWEYNTFYNITCGNTLVYHPNTMYLGECDGTTIRYNYCYDNVSEGFMWTTGDHDNCSVYGNVFRNCFKTIQTYQTDCAMNNFVIANNTFIDCPDFGLVLRAPVVSGGIYKNNLFYNCANINWGSSGGVDYNWYSGTKGDGGANSISGGSTQPFVNYSGGNYRIVSTIGTTYPRNKASNLGSPYNYDMDGVQRGADGTWDIGAFEYNAGGGGDTTAPTPNPMTFSSVPAATGPSVIEMTASLATDATSPPVQYYFDETTGNAGGTDSGWQASRTYSDSGLTPGTTYTYRVKAADAVGNETAYSSGFSATTTSDTTAPTPNPATFAVPPTAASASSITMTATLGTDATPPVQYYFDETSGNAGGTDSGWQTSATYTDSGLTPSTQYTYRVQMRDSVGTPNVGTYSTPASATTQADAVAPTPNPMTFSVAPTAISQTAIRMTASTATDALSPPVQYYFDETTGNSGGADSGWQTSASYTNSGLVANTTYTYRVRARDSAAIPNETAYSGSLSATTSGDTTPPSPNPSTFAVFPTATSETTITMTATTSTDALSPPVWYYFDETSLNAGGTDSGWQTNSSYVDTGLTPGVTYTYRVQTRDSAPAPNATTFSGSFNATTTTDTVAPTPNPATFAIVPARVNDTAITMTATVGTDAVSPPVQYFFDELSGNAGATPSGWISSPSYTDTGLSPKTTYSYRVKMRDSSAGLNETAWSGVFDATTEYGGPIWYVSPSGSDVTGEGSLALPYRTWTNTQYRAIASGDSQIVFLDGNYPGPVTVTNHNMRLSALNRWAAVVTNSSAHGIQVASPWTNAIVDGFKIVDSTSDGIKVNGKYCQIVNNWVTNAGNNGVLSQWSYSYISNNLITDSGITAGQHHGIYASGSNGVAAANTCLRNIDRGIQFWNTGDGISDGWNWLIVNNVLVGNYNGGVDYIRAGYTNFWLNNTIYANTNGGLRVAYGTAVIQNNIISSNLLAGGAGQLDIAVGTSPTVLADYNAGGVSLTPYNGAHDVVADVQFVDAANENFLLLIGSPCIDVGLAQTRFTRDRVNTLRPIGNGWDIGAYETVQVRGIPFPGRNVRLLFR